ncbi:hypothetical protein G7Y89_g1368 [Cudoniella acicularis]|uniref:Uncharacterized protein n=1 Tax=Cudoniella acicularis TaxID=354080 RepID=A0A8H4RVF6_9HELO|nr:hypothetical protein G7Y89_g1368 [Cudoniella acicularis]
MPIRLGDESFTNGGSSRLNDYLLTLLWILQFGTTLFFEGWLFLYIMLLGAFGSGGLSFLSLPIFLGNFAVLTSIIYEARLLKVEALTVTTYYRFQVVKME